MGSEMCIRDSTYRYRIFEKLSVTSDVELTLLAVRHGMVDASL